MKKSQHFLQSPLRVSIFSKEFSKKSTWLVKKKNRLVTSKLSLATSEKLESSPMHTAVYIRKFQCKEILNLPGNHCWIFAMGDEYTTESCDDVHFSEDICG